MNEFSLENLYGETMAEQTERLASKTIEGATKDKHNNENMILWKASTTSTTNDTKKKNGTTIAETITATRGTTTTLVPDR